VCWIVVEMLAVQIQAFCAAACLVIALKGDSYRLKDRDLGRVPAAAATDD
jgi:hypothetical protein